jgi:glyoxylase-like metal-dependent hydrolase (beta-lactamase superfamily II)
MRLTEHVRLVASGAAGFDLTDPLDCHAYLVEGTRRTALIDAGAGRSAGEILRAMSTQPDYLLLTHGARDHQALFSGDCVFTGGRVSPQNLHDCRIAEYAARLAQLSVHALFPGHHEISLARATRHLSAAHATMARGMLPESTV